MTGTEDIVGKFGFGTGNISASRDGEFVLVLFNGTQWQFDVGEISALDKILSRIENKEVEPTEENSQVFWRTNGSKVIEVFLGRAYFHSLSFWHWLEIEKPNYVDAICIREGGTKIGFLPVTEVPILRRHIRILTEDAPYPRAVRLVDVVEEYRQERLVRLERYPLNNRDSKSPIRVEKEFCQEIIKSVEIDASFGIGIDYYIRTNIESRFGLTREQRISESVKVTMEAEPGEHKEYIISWKEVISVGFALFDVNGVREKVPFRLKSGLIPVIRQEIVDNQGV